jgi:hypothetical protein
MTEEQILLKRMELKLECLKLASSFAVANSSNDKDILLSAKNYFEFIQDSGETK